MMARSNEPHPEAGYVDARPPTASSTKPSCNARPDHTSGQSRRSPMSVTCPLYPQLLSNWRGAAKRRDVAIRDLLPPPVSLDYAMATLIGVAANGLSSAEGLWASAFE